MKVYCKGNVGLGIGFQLNLTSQAVGCDSVTVKLKLLTIIILMSSD